jgi:hypothetical protein
MEKSRQLRQGNAGREAVRLALLPAPHREFSSASICYKQIDALH